MNEIEMVSKQELAWNGKRVKATDAQIVEIIGPMFVLFGSAKATGDMVGVYVMMLRDIDPQVLAAAVLKAMNACKFLPTVADIREQIPSQVLPGPNSTVERPANGRTKWERSTPEEDRRERMRVLRMSGGSDA